MGAVEGSRPIHPGDLFGMVKFSDPFGMVVGDLQLLVGDEVWSRILYQALGIFLVIREP